MEELKNKLLTLNKEDWITYIENILENKTFSPKLPVREEAPTLILIALHNIILELGIGINFYNNALQYHYNKIERDQLSIDKLSAIITISGILKPDLVRTFKRDFEQKLFKDYYDSNSHNLHILLLNNLAKYDLTQYKNEIGEELKNSLMQQTTKIDIDEYDFAVLNYFLTIGFEKEFFEYLTIAYKNTETNYAKIEYLIFSVEKFLFSTRKFARIMEWIIELFYKQLFYPDATFDTFMKPLKKYIKTEMQSLEEYKSRDITNLLLLIDEEYYLLIKSYNFFSKATSHKLNVLYDNKKKQERLKGLERLKKLLSLSNLTTSYKMFSMDYFKQIRNCNVQNIESKEFEKEKKKIIFADLLQEKTIEESIKLDSSM